MKQQSAANHDTITKVSTITCRSLAEDAKNEKEIKTYPHPERYFNRYYVDDNGDDVSCEQIFTMKLLG